MFNIVYIPIEDDWNEKMLIEFIFYGIGRITLLIFTFGKYPRGEKAYQDESTITIVGVCVCIILFILVYVFNYKF